MVLDDGRAQGGEKPVDDAKVREALAFLTHPTLTALRVSRARQYGAASLLPPLSPARPEENR